MRRSRCPVVLAMLCLCLIDASIHADSTGASDGKFLVDVWKQDDGVPRNSVMSFAQSPDGYLWLASDQALARFDGVRFVEAQAESLAPTPGEWEGPLRYVRRLFGGGAEAVWLTTSQGELWRWQGEEFEVWFPGNTSSRGFISVCELSASEVLAFTRSGRVLRGGKNGIVEIANLGLHDRVWPETVAADATGQVWFISGPGNVWRTDGQRAVSQPLGDQPDGRARAMAADSARQIWLGTDSGLLEWRTGAWEQVAPPDPGVAFPIRSILPGANGLLWVQSGETAWCRTGGQWHGPLADWPNPVPSQARVVDRQGRLWLAIPNQGVRCIHPDGATLELGPANGFTADATALFCDREGNLWASLYRSGVARVRDRRFTAVQVTDGGHETPVWNVAQDAQGAVWLSAEFKGPVRWQEAAETLARSEAGIDAAGWTKALTVDELGRVAAPLTGAGVLVFDGDSFQPLLPWPSRAGFARVLFQDDALRWWLGSDSGLHSWTANRWQSWGSKQGLPGYPIRSVAVDTAGYLWVGTFGGGVARWDGKRFLSFNRKSGLPDDFVYTLCSGADGSVWMGTHGGLARWKAGRFASFAKEQGLPDNRVVQILEDNHFLWLGTRDGLCRVDLNSVEPVVKGERRILESCVFDRDDGLPTRAFQDRASPGCWRAQDGRLWFLTAGGAVYCQPDRIRPDLVPPPVRIEEVVVDGLFRLPPESPAGAALHTFSAVAARRPGDIDLAPGPHVVEIRYNAPSLSVPEKVAFQYQMQGLDRDWVDAGPRRTALYSLLPPGKYRFRVRARNHDGIWNHAGAEMALVVRPNLWQQAWFPAVVGALLACSVGAGVSWVQRSRHQRQLARLELQHAREAERTRISRDLHDHLGASLTEIGMLAEDGAGLVEAPDAGTSQCRVIKEKVNAVVGELDALVWAMDPQKDSLPSLASYLASLVEEYAGNSGIGCQIALSESLPAWPLPSEVRHNLFLAVKEAIHNAVRHAAAQEISFRIHLFAGGLEILIADDGQGFDPAGVARGNGLNNLHQRLASIGGRCQIQSKPGCGTTVSLTLPIPHSPLP